MNSCCVDTGQVTLKQLYKSIGWSVPMPQIKDYYIQRVNELFPDALQIVSNKAHPIYAVSEYLPFQKTSLPDEFLFIDVYDGAISLSGLKKSFECPTCKQKGHVIVLNVRTLILMQHLLHGVVLYLENAYTLEKKEVLVNTIKSFCSNEKDRNPFLEIAPIPYGEWNIMTEMAFSWLLFHEFGHVIEKSQYFNPILPDVFKNKDKANEEVKADISSFQHLQMRRIALNPLDPYIKYLFAGIEFFLRTLSIIHAVSLQDISKRNNSKLYSGPHHPSSSLRIKYLEEHLDLEIKLGLIDSSVKLWKAELFKSWEVIFNQINL